MLRIVLVRLFLPFTLLLHTLMQVTPGLYFIAPADGQVVAGTVEIKGSAPEDNFAYAEVSYAFASGETANWFLIKRIDTPIHDDVLALWDTTTITDGVYRLRIRVYQKNNEVHEITLENIKVGNYTRYAETAVPTTAGEIQTATVMVPTATVPSSPEPTALPSNPASIDDGEFRFSLNSGWVLAVLFLGILAVYAYFRQKARK